MSLYLRDAGAVESGEAALRMPITRFFEWAVRAEKKGKDKADAMRKARSRAKSRK